MDLPLISIIIPVYNAEKTIGRAIKSIISQNSLDFELILINDGSNDNSLQIMEMFASSNSRIKVYNIDNAGVSYARNLGIKHARGKYTTFLDADDYYLESVLENSISKIEDKTQLLIFGFNIDYENKNSINRLPNEKNLSFSNKKILREYIITLIRNEMINAPWNKIYLTSYLKKNNIFFPEDINIGEDLKFNLSVIRDVQYVKIFNEILVNYTVKKGEGLVSRFRPNRFEIRYTLLMELKELFRYWNVLQNNQVMIDRMLMRDIMAYFMDFYKSNCKFSYYEKHKLINEVLSRTEIREVFSRNHRYDIVTRIIELILKTNNSNLILFFAKILNTKRVLR